ncbi:ABC transporter substrate-binding protein (plasmid) [Pseudorhodobacter turbinis]|uniref:ABC transporter substrate-binding protein n=1 Tax=Pseudorhodobacter turbinis TaxID=2500533 RepID=A0A4P8EJI5_9RHOB|nr:ABC transporter substrate-binding protein [Pseudorhodobacter turbinis]QCO57012.1 ABC transporter substrate-binding protein [Pseudorhodobacter turbinis]
MNDNLAKLIGRIDVARVNRRSFMGGAAAVGALATMGAPTIASAQPVKGGILKMGLGGGESTNSLDPALAQSQVTFHINRIIGETLVDVAADGTLDLRVAEAIESSADAKVWRFTIRKGVKFHNGTEVTPDDVLKTLERHSNKESSSGAFGIMENIESMRVDGDVIEVTMTTGNADLPYLMADYHLPIQPGGGMENPADGIGCGAYKVVVNEPGVRHTFEKHADYWDDTRGHYDGVEITVINDATARMAAVQSGQVHIANRVDPKIAKLLTRAPGLTVRNAPGRGHYVFIMHCDTAPFDNPELRRALKLAINREEMVDKILDGFGTIGNDTPINAAYPLFTPLEQRKFDVAAAAEAYKASGHDGSPIILRVADGAFPGAVDAAALFQQTAQAAGIPLEIKREPNDGYWSEVWNKQPFCASYWGGRPVQDQMFSTAYVSTADWNDTRFFNPEFDALVEEARAELDEAKRVEIYAKLSQMIHEDGGLICPMFSDFIEAVSDEVQGWEVNGMQEAMNGLAPHKTWLA